MKNPPDGVVAVPLTQGQFAWVDVDDFHCLIGGPWCAVRDKNNWYATRGTGPRHAKKTLVMHREIMEAKKGQIVDHINGNGLDNRRCNLRIVDRRQNTLNQIGQGLSKYKGVSWNARGWAAKIKHDGKQRFLGRFKTQEEAARAYDKAAREFHGEHGAFNFPRKGERCAIGVSKKLKRPVRGNLGLRGQGAK